MGLLETLQDILSRPSAPKAEYGPMSDALQGQAQSGGLLGAITDVYDPYIKDWKNSPEHKFLRGEIGFTPEVADRLGNAIAMTSGGVGAKGVPGYVDDAAVREANFKKWFGDSKVVDAEGKPLTVYHGTGTPGFSQFMRGNYGYSYHTPSPEYASRFAGEKGGVIHGNLSLKNPLDLTHFGDDGVGGTRLKDYLENKLDLDMRGIDFRESSTPIYNQVKHPELKYRLEKLGYDGIKLKESGETAYLSFQPEQFKSASNNGAYSQSNGDFLKSLIPAAATAYGIDQVLPYD